MPNNTCIFKNRASYRGINTHIMSDAGTLSRNKYNVSKKPDRYD